jgi:hypothetical protein
LGKPIHIPEWGCDVIVRPISAGGEDVVGCYPIAVLRADADLRGGLERLRAEGFVSVTLTLDDFHRPSLDELRKAFDVLQPFKTHFVHRGPLENYRLAKDHRYKVNRASRNVVAKPIQLVQHLEAWTSLYDNLIAKHTLSGVHAFPHASFAMLAQIPGVKAIGGFISDELVSCNLWVVHDGRAHSHLVASNQRGYIERAAYAVSDASVKYFADAETVNFGGGAGIGDEPGDGLAQFKRGFSNVMAKSYICGAILDRNVYERLSRTQGRSSDDGFFPAYRTPMSSNRTRAS